MRSSLTAALLCLPLGEEVMAWIDINDVADGTTVVGFRLGYETPVPFAGQVDTIGGKMVKTKVVLDTVSGRFIALKRVIVIKPENATLKGEK